MLTFHPSLREHLQISYNGQAGMSDLPYDTFVVTAIDRLARWRNLIATRTIHASNLRRFAHYAASTVAP